MYITYMPGYETTIEADGVVNQDVFGARARFVFGSLMDLVLALVRLRHYRTAAWRGYLTIYILPMAVMPHVHWKMMSCKRLHVASN